MLIMPSSQPADIELSPRIASGEARPEADEEDAGLEDVARGERNYLRDRLRGELGREPTEEELDEWLREHTEGY